MAYEIPKTTAPVEAFTHALNPMGYVHAIRRRKSLMCLGIVIGLTLGAIYYMRVPPVYESNAKILITNKNSDVLQSDPRSTGMEDQVANQISMIRSPLIAKEAADNSKVLSLPSFGEKSHASRTGAILGGLNATRGDLRSGESPSVVILSYRTGNPSDSKTVLEGVLEAHKKVMAHSYENLGEETVHLIETAKNDLTKQLEEKFKAYTEFRMKTLYSPVAKDGERLVVGFDKPSLSEKSVFQSRQEILLMRESEIRMHLKALETAKKAGRPPAALLAMAERFSSFSGAVAPEATVSEGLLMLLGQEEELASTFGDDYLPLQRLRARIALVRSFLPTRKSGYPRNSELDPLERHIKELTEESECNATMSEAYGTLIGNQKEQVRLALQNELEDEKLHGDWLRTKQLWETTVKRLQEINLVKG
ncbi:MAG TPA: Wzz/FepE/Etk N-terminal domain-containing protein, partial [Gemmataceae bacterium]|nr:Wzz/FepE/Etk N-terminal domain-containing protein [Gemmataceae bacterium]